MAEVSFSVLVFMHSVSGAQRVSFRIPSRFAVVASSACADFSAFHCRRSCGAADLVQATGLSRASLYGAFGDKDQLFERVVGRYREHMADIEAIVAGAPTSGQGASIRA